MYNRYKAPSKAEETTIMTILEFSFSIFSPENVKQHILIMAEKKKIEWLSILQGFSMLLVVIGHVSLTNVPRDPTTPVATCIERVIYSFHMPLFIFISGWLFYYTCLRKKKGYSNVVISDLPICY